MFKHLINVILISIHFLLGTFHTDQIEALLESATMSYGNEELTYESGSVEKCSCPSGENYAAPSFKKVCSVTCYGL